MTIEYRKLSTTENDKTNINKSIINEAFDS